MLGLQKVLGGWEEPVQSTDYKATEVKSSRADSERLSPEAQCQPELKEQVRGVHRLLTVPLWACD